jgi:energy-coupling factor transporter ATP-binding protein EcfA2
MQIINAGTIEMLDVTPREDVVIVEGANGHGKTTLLRMIEMAVKSDTDEKIVRDGEETATGIINLGEYTLRRVIKKGKTPTIEVRKTSDGKRVEISATEFIADITGRQKKRPIALDIAGIVGMDAKERLSVMLDIAGIDPEKIAELDARFKTQFDSRRDEKKELTRLEGSMNTLAVHAKPVDAPASTADLAKAAKVATDNLEYIHALQRDIRIADRSLSDADEEIARLQSLIEEQEKKKKEIKAGRDILEKRLSLTDEDAAIKEQEAVSSEMATADAKRTEYNNHVAYRTAKESWAKQQGVVDKAEKALTATIKEKKDLLATGKYPIPNLEVREGEIYFKDKHWDQLCESEKLKVALGIAQGLDPKLRVLLVRNGNAFDGESMRKIRAWAKQADFQIWMERVSSVPHLGDSVYLVEGKALTEEEKKAIIEQKKENPDE